MPFEEYATVDSANWNAFLEQLDGLLETDEVQSMRALPHHPGVNCFDHSIFVAYVAYRLARRWRLDCHAAARGGLLHDLYLYNSHDASAHPGNQCLDHPEFALRNALALTDLSEKEQNIIVAHMWPLGVHLPHSREAWTVSLADKICATLEVSGVWKRLPMRAVLTKRRSAA